MTFRPITPEQFELVRPLIEQFKKKTRPRKHSLYDVLCAILERDAANLAWRELPDYAPAWRTVHQYHMEWTMTQRDGSKPLLDQVKQLLSQGIDHKGTAA